MSEENSLELEYLSQLKLFNNHLQYGERVVRYSDIAEIEYYAVQTRHSVNFIPTGTDYDAYLKLHVQGDRPVAIAQEWAYRSSQQKMRAEAVMRAADIIGEITFTDRYERYERQLAEKNFIEFAGYQFNRDGDIFSNNIFVCNIKNGTVRKWLSAFEFSFEYPVETMFGFRRRRVRVVDLKVNRDCFLRFLRDTFGYVWKDEKIREKRRKVTELEFQSLVLKLCARLSKVDGRITADEILRIKAVFGITDETLPGAADIFREAAKESARAQALASSLRDLFGSSKEPLYFVWVGLIQIAIADGKLHPAEEEFLRDVAQTFGIPGSELESILLAMKAEVGARNKTDSYSDETMCYEILGIAPGASIEMVKSAYREKARRHHPDILRANGVDPEKIKESERLLVIINKAYATLIKKAA